MSPMSTDPRELYRSALAAFGERVHGVREGQWGLRTPCSEWDVGALVNHLVGENRWVVPLFAGASIADVGSRLDGDLLGSDPVAAWDDSAAQAIAAIDDEGSMDRTVHLSFGDFPGREYAMQLFADLLVHGWDLARATGQSDTMDPHLVAACAQWFAPIAEMYRAGGVVGPRPNVSPTADPSTILLADFGRAA